LGHKEGKTEIKQQQNARESHAMPMSDYSCNRKRARKSGKKTHHSPVPERNPQRTDQEPIFPENQSTEAKAKEAEREMGREDASDT
jgi:hypothetical protein